MVLGFGRNALLANHLTKQDYGALNYLLGWLPLIGLLLLPGFNMAIAQYVAKGHWEAVRLGLRRRLFFALLPVVTLIAVGWAGIQLGRSEFVPALWFVTALFFPTTQVLGLISGVLGALKRFRHQAHYHVGQSAVFLLATTIGLWLWSDQATTGIVVLHWLLLSLLNVWSWARLRRPEAQSVPLSPVQQGQFYRF